MRGQRGIRRGERRDAAVVRRLSWATALMVAFTIVCVMFTAASLRAQNAAHDGGGERAASCPATVMPSLAASAATASLAVGAELGGMTRTGRWQVMQQDNPGAIAADPSSHLHALGSYHLARVGAHAFTRCQSASRAAVSGAVWSIAVGVTKEIADGWYTGFSTVDLAVDALGAGYALAQQRLPVLQHVTPTISLAPQALRSMRAARGATTDYANQTVWLSTNVRQVLPGSAGQWWPAAARLSAGRRAMGGSVPSEYVVGIDLDPTALPGTHPGWMRVKRALRNVRLPGPAIVMSRSGTRAVGLYW